MRKPRTSYSMDCGHCKGEGIGTDGMFSNCNYCKGRGFHKVSLEEALEGRVFETEFLATLEPGIFCPYCGEPNQLDPPMLCCGEVHAEEGWFNADDEALRSDEFDDALKEFTKLKFTGGLK
jgi:hypothetical protein